MIEHVCIKLKMYGEIYSFHVYLVYKRKLDQQKKDVFSSKFGQHT
jgi:hypothetical protein